MNVRNIILASVAALPVIAAAATRPGNTGMDLAQTGIVGNFNTELRWTAERWGLGPALNVGSNPALPTYADYVAASTAAVDLDGVGRYFNIWADPVVSNAQWIQPTSGLTVTYLDSLGVEQNSPYTESTTNPTNYRTNQSGFIAYSLTFEIIDTNDIGLINFQYTTDNASNVYIVSSMGVTDLGPAGANVGGSRTESQLGSLSAVIDPPDAAFALGQNTIVVISMNDFVGSGTIYGLNLAQNNPTGLLFVGTIPEASTYGAVIGLAGLAFVALRRRQR